MTRPNPVARPGVIAPLTAILLTTLIAVVAFAVDLGWIVLVQSDLQSAADASALAGAGALMNGFTQYTLAGIGSNSSSAQSTIITSSQTAAKTAAKNYATLNGAGVSSLTLNDSDIEFGYTDGSGNYTTPAASGKFPNTVKVTMRRDSNANGALGLFFGPAVGLSSTNLTAVAAATIYTASVNSIQNVAGLHVGLLPMTYDVNHWNGFLATGQDPDGNSNTDSNGIPDLQVYPSVKDTGNFGLLGLDDSHVGTSTLSGWIANGFSQTDMQNLVSNSQSNQTPLIPLSSHNQNILPSAATDGLGSWNWVGDTGLKTSDLHTLDNYVGNTYLLPLFKPLDSSTSNYTPGNDNGSRYYYNIVQFVSVKIISSVNSNMGGLVVEPSPMVLDFSQLSLTNVVPAGTAITTSFTFAPPKLTQ
jgi:Flp pilus assembly protein TadG